MDCNIGSSRLSIRDLNQLLDQVEALLLHKAPSLSQMRIQNRAVYEYSEYLLLGGEVIIFRNSSVSMIESLLASIGLEAGDFEIQTSGHPVFFSSSETSHDYVDPLLRFLRHEDLPYGFAGDGRFHFGSVEVESLSTAPAPVRVEGYLSYNGQQTPNAIADTQPHFIGYPVVEGSSMQEAFNNIEAGKYPHITYIDKSGNIKTVNFVDPRELALGVGLVEDYMDGGSGEDGARVDWIPVMGDYFNDDFGVAKDVGWCPGWLSAGTGSGVGVSQEYPILIMPKNQMSAYEVNPYPQQPYLGAEGIYPVILVELKRDVEIMA